MSAAMLGVIPPEQARPIAWHRLVWVSWRRHRGSLLGVAAVVAAVGVYLFVSGIQVRSAYDHATSCRPQNSLACRMDWLNFHNSYSSGGVLRVVYVVLPLLIGAFIGAPIIGRELESGTFRFVWTQGVGRMRWAIAMIASGAIATAILSGAFGLLVTWHDSPLWQADIVPHWQAGEFSATGIAVVGWGLLAYAVALIVGLLARRVVPAIGVALAAGIGIAALAAQLRQHYLPPLKTTSLNFVSGSNQISQWWQKGDVHVGQSALDKVLKAAGLPSMQQPGQSSAAGQHATDPTTYLTHHGYELWTSYQPSGRFWLFQWIEFGWLFVLVAILVAVTFMLLRRRDA